jgi:hypothetical protein
MPFMDLSVTGSKIKMLIEKLVLIFKNFCAWHIANPKYYESRATITSCAFTAEYVPLLRVSAGISMGCRSHFDAESVAL